MRKLKKVGGVSLVALVAAVVVAVNGNWFTAVGFWDSSKAVHIKPGDIESSTLAIGTHLIHLSALTDSIYEIANQSAEESGQNTIYYKSELGGNAWFDITEATSLADISTEGAPATESQIAALFFTHHTKSDQKTYDLRTGREVSVFDVRDPYDLESLDELQPLKMRYDMIYEMEGKNDVTRRIDKIWKTPVEGAKAPQVLKDQDESLKALQKYLNVLTENEADAKEIDAVNGVMAAVDATRRYHVFAVLESALQTYLDELSAPPPEEGEEEEEAADAELLSSVSESLSNVQASMITYGGEMLSDGTTVVSSAEYDFSLSLINHAKQNDHASCDGDVQNLLILKNIQESIISDRPREMELLENKLLPEATRAYLSVLGRGESGDYKAHVAKRAAQALLNRFINEHDGETQACRGELEFLIQAKCDRLSAADALTFVGERLTLTTSTFKADIPKDDFFQVSGDSVDDHITFLTDLQRSLEQALGGNEMDRLEAEKEALQQEMMAALDRNDLAAADALSEEIAAIEEAVRAIEAETSEQIAQLQSEIAALEDGSPEKAAAEAELKALENSLSDGSLGAMVAATKKEALEAIGDDAADPTAATDALLGLLPMAPDLVLPALQEVYNELVLDGAAGGGSAATALLEDTAQALLDAVDASADGLLNQSEINEVLADSKADSPQLDEAAAALLNAAMNGPLSADQIGDILGESMTQNAQVETAAQALLSAAATGPLSGDQMDDILSDFKEQTGELETMIELLMNAADQKDGGLTGGEINAIISGSSPLTEELQDLSDTLADALKTDSSGTLTAPEIEAAAGGSGTLPPALQDLDQALDEALAEDGDGTLDAGQIQDVINSLGALPAAVEELSDALDAALAGDGDGKLNLDQIKDAVNGVGDLSPEVETLADRLDAAMKQDADKQLDKGQIQGAVDGALAANSAPSSDAQALLDRIEQAILENPNALMDSLSASALKELTRQWLLEQNDLDARNPKPLSGVGGLVNLNPFDTAAVILGLQMHYEETGNPASQTVAAALAREQIDLGSTLVFEGVNDPTGEYLPLTAIQTMTGRRYIWNKNASLGVLAYGADYYGFTVYQDTVQRDREGMLTEKMPRAAKYQGCVHVPEEYTLDQFGVQAQYLSGTTVGLIYDETILALAQEFLAKLLEG